MPKWIWAEKIGHSQRNNVLAPIWSWGLGILKWKMSKQAHQSQSQPQQNQWSKTNKKKYKQRKARTKGILDVWQTQRLMNKRQAIKLKKSMIK